MFFPIFVLVFLLFTSFLTHFAVLPTRTDGFSANVHQSIMVQLSGKVKAENRNGEGEEEQRKKSSERVVRHHQQQKMKRTKCERLSEAQKYAKLEKVGGRNQVFMAASPREAGRNFPALMPKKSDHWTNNAEEEQSEIPFVDLPLMDDDGTPIETPFSAPSPKSVEECDEQCREIERKLNDAVEMEWQMSNTGEDETKKGIFRMDDDAEEEAALLEDDGRMDVNWAMERGETFRIRRSGCHLERFVPIGNCTKHGFEEAMGDEKLCTACQGIYVLNRECFPMFVNSVVCDRREFECIFDRFSGSAQGKCRPKVLSFKVMRNRGTTAECEQWAFEYIEVPVACECYLSKRSVWLEAVPPSIGDEHLL